MLEQKLQEELNRYKAINKYGKTMIMEQAGPEADPTAVPPADTTAVPPADTTATPAPDMTAPMADTTEEIDITDLVDMVKSVKHDFEQKQNDNTEVISKMDDVFTKLGDLEQKLAQMDQVMAKIDMLGAKVEEMKPETPVEKLEMRSLDSYPFNEKPNEFFAHKQDEMKQSGKNEYILTKDEVSNYDPKIKQSFNPEEEQDEYSF
jgi:hypothetical protein